MSSRPPPPHLRHPDRAARASFAKHTINTVIPHILHNNTRARVGNESTKTIYYNPSSVRISRKSQSSTNAQSSASSAHKAKTGKITSYFTPVRAQNEVELNSSLGDYSGTVKVPESNTTLSNATATEANSEEAGDPNVANTTPKNVIGAPQPEVSVIQADTLNAAQIFVDPRIKSRRIAVLNMASFLRPGGGVMQGAIAQEESLCLRSTLYTSLDEKFYRLPKFGGLYTKDVLVFRDSDNQDIPKSDWFFVDVISVAALKNPDLLTTKDGREVYEYEQDKEEMISKIKLILIAALENKVTHLVLGALGCGAYHNPPEEVAKMFKRVISGDRHGRGAMNLTGMEQIVFAIFDNGVNLRVFREILVGPKTPQTSVHNQAHSHASPINSLQSEGVDHEMEV